MPLGEDTYNGGKIMFTNQMRFTGMSGIDVQGMVEQLMRAHSVRLDRLRQDRDIMRWRQEQFRSTAADMRAMQNRFLSFTGDQSRNIRSEANWFAFSASISGIGGAAAPTGVTVNATSRAVAANMNVNVHQVARNDIFRTHANINHNAGVVAQYEFERDSFWVENPNVANVDHPTFGETHIFQEIQFRVTLNGSTTTIRLTREDYDAADASSDFNNHILGRINAQMDTAFGLDGVGSSLSGGRRIEASFVNGRLNINTNANRSHRATVRAGIGAHEESLTRLGFADNNDVIATLNLTNTTVAQFMGLTAGPGPDFEFPSDVRFTIGGLTFSSDILDTTAIHINGNTSMQSIMETVNTHNGSNATMSFNDSTGQFTIEGRRLGASNNIVMNDHDGNFLGTMFGVAAGGQFNAAHMQYGEGFRRSTASDAMITVTNAGQTITRQQNHNTFTDMNGVNITLDPNAIVYDNAHTIAHDPNSTDPEDWQTLMEFQVNTTRDIAHTRSLIEEFIEGYNALVRTLRGLTETRRPTTTSSSGRNFFMPLTDEQRRTMSDREVEQWEEQARTGLLHRDDTLRRLFNDLHAAMFGNVDLGDGRTINLTAIGIRTSTNLEDFGILVIDNPERLDSALENRLDDVMQLFRGWEATDRNNRDHLNPNHGITERVNNIINWQLSSRGGIFEAAGLETGPSRDDNRLSRRINEQEARIDAMIARLERRESRYFVQFSRLEVAMMQANSQMDFLHQIMWGGQ